MAVASDEIERVEAAIEQSKTSATDPFVGLLFYHSELPPSLFTAQMFQKFRTDYTPESIGQIFVIDAAKNAKFALKYGVIPTPALVVIWKGNPLVIRRPGWDDSAKVIGCMKGEEWLSILRFMVGLPKTEERKFLSVNIS
jgi:hypothetical protein